MAQHNINYSNYTTGQEPSDWSQDGWSESGIWTVQEDAKANQGTQLLRFQETIDNNYPRILQWDTPTDVDGEVEILALLRADGPTLGVFLRQQQYMEAYYGLLDVAGGNLTIGYRGQWDWNHNEIGSQAFSFTQGGWYYVRYRAEGSDLKLKVWASGNSEPAGWDLQASDTGITSAGGMGVFARNKSGTNQTTYFFDYAGVGTESDSAPMPAEEPTPVGVALTNTPQTLAAEVQIESTEEQPNTDFGDYTTGEEPSDWSQDGWTEGGIWAVQDDAKANQGTQLLRFQETVDNNYPRILRWETPTDKDGEVEIIALLRADGPTLGVFLRQQQYMNAYYGLLDIADQSIQIGVRRDNWDWNHITLSSLAKSFTQGSWYYVRFRAEGSNLKLKVWASGNPEPAGWDLQATDDPGIPSGGGMGVFARNIGGGSQTSYFFDYVSVGLNGSSAPLPKSKEKEAQTTLTNAPQPLEAKVQTPKEGPWVSLYLRGSEHKLEAEGTKGNWGELPHKNIDTTHFTHLMYFALHVNDGQNTGGTLDQWNTFADPEESYGTPFPDDYVNVNEDRRAAIIDLCHDPKVEKPVIMSIGGADNSGFQDAIMDSTSRSNLVDACVELITNFEFDGVDLDYEENKGSAQVTAFGAFVDELYDAFQNVQTPLLDRPLITTATTIDNQEWGKMLADRTDKFDQINLMTYDLSGPYGGWWTWHNSPAYSGNSGGGDRLTHPSTTEAVPSMDRNIEEALNFTGANPAKYGIGVDFFGYIWKTRESTTTESEWPGWMNPREGPQPDGFDAQPNNEMKLQDNDEKPYRKLYQNFDIAADGKLDTDAGANWVPKDTDADQSRARKFVSYNDEDSFPYAKQVVDQYGLGGIIVWSYSGGYFDPGGHQHQSGEKHPLANKIKEEFM